MSESAWLFARSQMVPKRSRKRYLYICIQSLENGPSWEKDQPTWVLWGWAQSRSAQASLASSPVHVLLATWHHHSRARGWWVWRKRKAAKGVLERFVARFLWECIPVQQGRLGRFFARTKEFIQRWDYTEAPLTIHDRHHQPLTVGTMPGTTEYEPERQGLLLVAWNIVSQLALQDVWCFWAICETLHQTKGIFLAVLAQGPDLPIQFQEEVLVTETISGQKQPRSAIQWLNKWIISSKALGRLLRCALPSFQL